MTDQQETKPKSAREIWMPGTRWKVIKEGARLSGMQSRPGYMQGWGYNLPLNEIIQCEGIKMGWGSDPVPEAMFSNDASREAHASFVGFYPTQGMWKAWPIDGYLELVPEAPTARVVMSRHRTHRRHSTFTAEVPAEMLRDPRYFDEDGDPTPDFDQWMCDNGAETGVEYSDDGRDIEDLNYEIESIEERA